MEPQGGEDVGEGVGQLGLHVLPEEFLSSGKREEGVMGGDEEHKANREGAKRGEGGVSKQAAALSGYSRSVSHDRMHPHQGDPLHYKRSSASMEPSEGTPKPGTPLPADTPPSVLPPLLPPPA